MTRHSFTEAIQNAAPRIIRATHYSLAPDAYGLDDGYAWAFSETARGEYIANAHAPADQIDAATGKPAANARTYGARHHLTDGGEWPYYIAATPTPVASRWDDYTAAVGRAFLGGPDDATAPTVDPDGDEADPITAAELREAIREGRVLETYAEGDLTAYIFDTADERDEAAAAWMESGAEFAARVLIEDHDHATSYAEKLGEAVAECFADRSGHGAEWSEQITRDDVAATMEAHEGEYDTAADWAEARYFDEVEAALERSGLPLEVYAAMRPDWRRVAEDAGSNGSGVTVYGGHAFRDN